MQRAVDRAACIALPVVRPNHRPMRRAVIGVAAATAACLALGLWLSRPTNLWAEVVSAVQAKPWIHGINRGSKAEATDEFWISMTGGDIAFRAAGESVFSDSHSRIDYRYEQKTKTLYRDRADRDETGY